MWSPCSLYLMFFFFVLFVFYRGPAKLLTAIKLKLCCISVSHWLLYYIKLSSPKSYTRHQIQFATEDSAHITFTDAEYQVCCCHAALLRSQASRPCERWNRNTYTYRLVTPTVQYVCFTFLDRNVWVFIQLQLRSAFKTTVGGYPHPHRDNPWIECVDMCFNLALPFVRLSSTVTPTLQIQLYLNTPLSRTACYTFDYISDYLWLLKDTLCSHNFSRLLISLYAIVMSSTLETIQTTLDDTTWSYMELILLSE